MEQTLFGRLLAFWQGGAPQAGWADGIGFWQKLRRRSETPSAEKGEAALQEWAASPEKREKDWGLTKWMPQAEEGTHPTGRTATFAEESRFWQKKEPAERTAQDDARLLRGKPAMESTEVVSEEKKALGGLGQAAKAGKIALPDEENAAGGEKRQESGLFAAAFREMRAAREENTLRGQRFSEMEPLAAERTEKRLPLGERVQKAKEPQADAEQMAFAAEKERETEKGMAQKIDVDALMRQLAQRLREEREGASRRSYR